MNAIRTNPERRRLEGRPNPDVPNISVVCRAGVGNPDDVLAITKEWPGWEGRGAPHGKVQHATVGAIRQRGYDVVQDEPPPGHALVAFSHAPTEQDRINLLGAVDPVRDNPLKRNLGMELPHA